MFAVVGWQELLPVFIIVVILFGARKLPELGKSLGQGIKEFRKASKSLVDGDDDEDKPSPEA